jgi:WD40 repeat protein
MHFKSNKHFCLVISLFLLTQSLFSQSHKSPVYGLSFSADGAFLNSFSNDGDGVKVWDVKNKTFSYAISSETPIILLPDGKSYLTISTNSELIVKVWDLESKKELRTIFYDEGKLFTFNYAVSPDGKYLVCMGRDTHILTFDLTTGELIKKWGKRNSQNGISFHRNSQKFYLTEGNEVIAYDLKTLEAEIYEVASNDSYRLKDYKANFTVSIASFAARKLGYTDIIRVYADNGKTEISNYSSAETTLKNVLLSPVSDEVIVMYSNEMMSIGNLKTKVWKNLLTVNYSSKIYGKVTLVTNKSMKRAINQIVFSPDGKTLAVGTGNSFTEGDKKEFWIYLIDVETGKLIAELNQK